MSAPIRVIRSSTVVLPLDDVDTDRIIPARFLTTTTRTGLGEALFSDSRRDAVGNPRPDSPFDQPGTRAAKILVAGRNFGCGSSREHAVWALQDFGFAAVIARSLADIFRRNALGNGLLAIEVPEPAHAALVAAAGETVTLDLEERLLTLPDGSEVVFPIDPFARHCLLAGLDELAFILAHGEAIAAHEAAIGEP
jgi:3-isopropylmalate/(R)-2-methylmalate dehydratase small subunit